MSSVIITYDLKKITVRSSRKNIWILGTVLVIYIVAFLACLLFVLYKIDSSPLMNTIVVAISAGIFLIVLLKDKRFSDKKFIIELSDNEIRINNLVKAQTKKIDRIIIKEVIPATSASPYYNVYAIFMGNKYAVIKGVSETDQKEIVKAFKSFFNIPQLPVEIRQA